jgi:hypothetical protein
MKGGAVSMEEIQRVSELFDADKVGPNAGMSGGDSRIVSTQTGLTGTVDEVSQMVRDSGVEGLLQAGGARRRWTRKTRRWTQRGGRKTRFRLNIRASIRLRHRHRHRQ